MRQEVFCIILKVIFISTICVVVARPASNDPADYQFDFLKKFGYLESSGPEALYAESAVVDAIKKVQLYGGLPQTGNVDNETIQLMKSKRCGVPDIHRHGEYGSVDVTANNSIKRHRFRRYILGSKGWTKRTVTYFIANVSPQLSEKDVSEQLHRAFEAWGNYSFLKFKRVYTEQADIVAKFGTYHHGDPFPFDGPGSVLAHAFYPMNGGSLGGDIHFDDDEKWVVNAASSTDGVDFFAVAIHELGHSLGLSHSPEQDSIMNPYYRGTQQLGHDDILALYELYASKSLQDDNSAEIGTTSTSTLPPYRSSGERPPRLPPRQPSKPHFRDPSYERPHPRFPLRHPHYSGEDDGDRERPRWTSKPYVTTPKFYQPETSTAVIKHYTSSNSNTESTTEKKPHVSITERNYPTERTTERRRYTLEYTTDRGSTEGREFTRSTSYVTQKSRESNITYFGDDEDVNEHLKHAPHKNHAITFQDSVLVTQGQSSCDITIDAAGYLRGEFFFFSGKYLYRLRGPDVVESGYPVEFLRFFRTLPKNVTKIDAVYERPTDSNIILFYGRNYLIFDGNKVIDGGPKFIREYGLPTFVDNVDAAFSEKDITYLFSGALVWSYNETAKSVTNSAPISSVFREIPRNLDSALKLDNGEIHFFKGGKYWVINENVHTIAKGYPRNVADFWISCDKYQLRTGVA